MILTLMRFREMRTGVMAKAFKLLGLTGVCLLITALLTPPTASAESPEMFYYWVAPFPSAELANRFESFVIEVTAAQKTEIEARNAEGPVIFDGQIAAGSVPYNKNYHAANQPVWNWHFVSIDNLYTRQASPPGCIGTRTSNCESHPSDIAGDPAQWIANNGTYYFPTKYYIVREVDPARKDALANVSNRGVAGVAEKTLITGLIITGGEPRNVVVRALGPSLSAAGVQQAAANPKIELYRGSTRVASNADWQSDARADVLRNSYPALAPTNGREAAMFLTLLPGAYTLHGINETGTEGVVLLEAYDVDAGNP